MSSSFSEEVKRAGCLMITKRGYPVDGASERPGGIP